MLRNLFISVAALSMAAPASAAFVVTFPSTIVIPSPQNNFKADLNGLGLFSYASLGATLSLNSSALIKFEFFGSESGFNDTFKAIGLDGTLTQTENTLFTAWGPQLIGTKSFGPGSLAGLLNFSAVGPSAQSATAGQTGFGIFTRQTGTGAGGFSSNVIWLGYDDSTATGSDNHDDMIIKATILAVPEPATWAMMVGGIGIAGMALRRRRNAGAAVLA